MKITYFHLFLHPMSMNPLKGLIIEKSVEGLKRARQMKGRERTVIFRYLPKVVTSVINCYVFKAGQRFVYCLTFTLDTVLIAMKSFPTANGEKKEGAKMA